jgi:hypothetical protein
VRLRIVIVLLAAAALLAPLAQASVSWGGRTFTSRPELCAWLAARGARCDVWSVRHPYAWQRFESRPRPQPPAIRPQAAPARGGGLDARVALLLAAAAAVLVAFAVAASRRLPVSRSARAHAWFVATAFALAVLTGVGVTHLLS